MIKSHFCELPKVTLRKFFRKKPSVIDFDEAACVSAPAWVTDVVGIFFFAKRMKIDDDAPEKKPRGESETF